MVAWEGQKGGGSERARAWRENGEGARAQAEEGGTRDRGVASIYEYMSGKRPLERSKCTSNAVQFHSKKNHSFPPVVCTRNLTCTEMQTDERIAFSRPALSR
eukprot:Gb_13052 [translate_table: standard]